MTFAKANVNQVDPSTSHGPGHRRNAAVQRPFLIIVRRDGQGEDGSRPTPGAGSNCPRFRVAHAGLRGNVC
jgi:hypothetical protein